MRFLKFTHYLLELSDCNTMKIFLFGAIGLPSGVSSNQSNSFFIPETKPTPTKIKEQTIKSKAQTPKTQFSKNNLKRWENTTFIQLSYGEIGLASYHFQKWNTSYIDYSKANYYDDSKAEPWNWLLDNNKRYPNKVPFEKVQIKTQNNPKNDTHSIFAAINFKKSCNSSVDNGVYFRHLHLTLVYDCFITGYLEDFDQNHKKIEYDFEGDYLFGFNMRNQIHYVRDSCWPPKEIQLAAELGLGKYVYGRDKGEKMIHL